MHTELLCIYKNRQRLRLNQAANDDMLAICHPILKHSSYFFRVIWKKYSKFAIDQVFLPHPIPKPHAYMLNFWDWRLPTFTQP